MSIPPGLLTPLHPAGREPLPPGLTEDDRVAFEQTKMTEKYMTMAMESCVAKSVLSGGAGTRLLLQNYVEIDLN